MITILPIRVGFPYRHLTLRLLLSLFWAGRSRRLYRVLKRVLRRILTGDRIRFYAYTRRGMSIGNLNGVSRVYLGE